MGSSLAITRSEENYAQLEEALALVFGVYQFQQFVYGSRFTLLTDHKPLPTILGSHTGPIPPQGYNVGPCYYYSIDSQSVTLPIVGTSVHEEGTMDAEVYNLTQLETLPITYQQLKAATNHDPILGQVVQCIQNGWPVAASEELKPYVAIKLMLTLQDDCALWRVYQVLIPKKLQASILEELHKDQAGICHIKALAQIYV